MINKYLPTAAVSVLIMSGCSDRPKGILSEEKMVAVMTDLQIAEAYERYGDANGYLQGRDRELLGRGVLLQHGVTPEEMDSTLSWYGRNMDEYPKLYKKIDEELNRRQLKYARAAGESENEGSSADLWPYSRHYAISEKSLSDGLVVSIPATDLKPGDKLTWKMTVDGAQERTLTLGVDYSDGSSDTYRQTNRGYEKRIEISLQTDSARMAERVFAIADFGYSGGRVLVDSVQLLHLPFNREEYTNHGFQHSIRPAGRKTILPPDSSTNSSLVPDEMIAKPSLSTEKSLGDRTLR